MVATTSAPSTAARSSRSDRVRVAAVVLGLLVVYGPTLVWLYGRWTMSVWHNAHGLFIPPLVGWLIYQELRRTPDIPRDSSVWGLALLVPALVLHVLDTGIQTQLLSAVSLILALPGLALLFLGWERTRLIAFPLLFTAFALPIPLAFTEKLHLALRHLTTALVSPSLSATGVSVYTEGTTLYLANATVEIADACSGFSTLYASLAFAVLLAYFSGSSRRRLLILAVAAPIAIASNVTRMILLLHLVAWKGSWVLHTFIHPLSGMLTFAVALPVLMWLGGDRPAKVTHAPPAAADSLRV